MPRYDNEGDTCRTLARMCRYNLHRTIIVEGEWDQQSRGLAAIEW